MAGNFYSAVTSYSGQAMRSQGSKPCNTFGYCCGLRLALGPNPSLSCSEASARAFYGQPEGQRGIFVGGGGPVRIPLLIGMARTAD